jgi:DNA polymerase delta subunit 1
MPSEEYVKFQVLDWNIEDDSQEHRTRVCMYGLNENDESVTVIIPDFVNYVYLQLPTVTEVTNKPIVWCEKLVRLFRDHLFESSKQMQRNEGDYPFFKLLYKKPLYYYQEHAQPFLAIACTCQWAMKNLVSALNDIKYEVEFEIGSDGKKKKRNKRIVTPKLFDIPRLGKIRVITCCDGVDMSIKFITAKDGKFTGWYEAKGLRVAKTVQATMSVHEFVVKHRNIQSVQSDSMAKPMLASFDIECYSKNHKAMPKCENPTDECYLISVALKRLCAGEECIEKVAFCSKPFNPDKVKLGRVVKCEDETDLYIKFKDFMLASNPDVITGYNIFTFDFMYLCKRAKEYLFIWDEFSMLSKIWNHECLVNDKGWSSDAYGAMNFYFPITPGRVHLDVYTYIQREYKLIKYKMDFVAKKFLGRRKHDITAKQMFEIFESGDEDKMSEVIDYCIQDTILPLLLIEKLNIWVGLVEMSNVSNAPILHLQTRGQQIKTFASIFREADGQGFVITPPPPPAFDHFQGATVINPVPGVYEYIPGHDFASLYPTIMIAYNVCYTTLLKEGLHDHIPDSMCNVLEWEEHIGCEHAQQRKTKIDESRKVCGKKFRYRFVKKEVHEGIIPRILVNLLGARKKTRVELAKYTDDQGKALDKKDSLLCNILDKRQLSQKVTCNSTYGFLGVGKNGMLPLMEGAASVTAMGRQLISITINYIKQKYNAKLIYGDTDSCFHDFGTRSASECFEIGHKISAEVSALFPPPVKLEFEKVIKKLIIFTKKRYQGTICDKDGNEKGTIFKGIVTAKRGGAPYLRTVYKEISDMATHDAPKRDVEYAIIQGVMKMFGMGVSLNKLTMIVNVGKSKDEELAQVYLVNEERRRGIPVQEGERFEYIFIKSTQEKQKHHVETPRFYRANPGVVKIDYLYYLERQFMKPLEEIMTVVYKDSKFMKQLYLMHLQKRKVNETIERIGKRSKLVFLEK